MLKLTTKKWIFETFFEITKSIEFIFISIVLNLEKTRRNKLFASKTIPTYRSNFRYTANKKYRSYHVRSVF